MNINDYWGFSSSNPCLCVGGDYFQVADHGLFFVYRFGASGAVTYIGCRLMEL